MKRLIIDTDPRASDEWIAVNSLPTTVAIVGGIIHDYLNLSKGE